MNNTATTFEKPLAEILTNVEVELSQLGQVLERLQITVSPLLLTAVCTAEAQKNIQSLDLVTQQIQGLAIVMGGLASVIAPEWLISPRRVVATLTLQDLADRVCGEAMTKDSQHDGDLELL